MVFKESVLNRLYKAVMCATLCSAQVATVGLIIIVGSIQIEANLHFIVVLPASQSGMWHRDPCLVQHVSAAEGIAVQDNPPPLPKEEKTITTRSGCTTKAPTKYTN
jgi:hypothetical protein